MCSYEQPGPCGSGGSGVPRRPPTPVLDETLTLPLGETAYLDQAANSALATRTRLNDGSDLTVLAVATRYQNQINGFILLYDRQSRKLV